MREALVLEDNTDIKKRDIGLSTSSSNHKSPNSNGLIETLSVTLTNTKDCGEAAHIDNFIENKRMIDGLINEVNVTRKNSCVTENYSPTREIGDKNEMVEEVALTVSYSTKDSQK